MESIYNWLIGNMGTPGEYSYGTMHLLSVLAVVCTVAATVLFSCSKKISPRHKRRLLIAISVFHLAFEILWRVIYLLVKKAPVTALWPMYPCNLGGLLLPVIALCNWKSGKRLFYLFGFVGGCLTFALPDGIFCSDVLTFPILKSILQHTGLLLIPVLEYAAGGYRPKLQDLPWTLAGCLVHILNCEGIDRLLGFTGDYMFLRGDLPFVIPGVPQFITMSVFGAIVLALLSFLSDIPGSLKGKKDKTAP